jgi:flagellar motor switch protein FliM
LSDILSQAEIEALLNSLGSDTAPASAGDGGKTDSRKGPSPFDTNDTFVMSGGGSKAAIAYEVYDFRRPDKFSKDQLRTLQMLHETFARLAGTALSAYLRTPINVDLISLEQVPYEEYLRSINTSVFTIMSLPPLSGQAVLELEFQLIFSMVDKLLGGPGRGVGRTNLTDIEKPLVRQMIERMFGALKTAWEGIVIINPGIEAMETSAQFVQIAPPSDIVVTILFEVKIGNSRGAMSVCIPYLVLKPITAKLSAQKWFVNNSRKNSGAARRLLTWQVQNTHVDCAVELGKSRMHIKDFLRLKTGDIIPVNRKQNEPFIMKVANNDKFEVQPGLKGKNLCFTVTDTVDVA